MNDHDQTAAVERSLSALNTILVSSELAEQADELFVQAAAQNTEMPTRKGFLRRMAKIAAAAIVVLSVAASLFATRHLWQSTAWAAVIDAMAHVRNVHFYEFKFREHRLANWGEGCWTADVVWFRKSDGRIFIDNGKTQRMLDKNGVEVRAGKSEFGQVVGTPFTLEVLLRTFSLSGEDYRRQEPSQVGDAFLVYRFDPPADKQDWVRMVEVTVGKGSRLPALLKVYRKDQENAFDMYVIDYAGAVVPTGEPKLETPEAPRERKFGKGGGKLGQVVTIAVPESPGVKALEVRPYLKDFGQGELLVVDMALILEDGQRRSFAEQLPISEEKPIRGGMGDARWPDGKFRHISYALRCRLNGDDIEIEATAWFDPLP